VATKQISIAHFLSQLSKVVINPLIGLVFAVATVVFLYGIFQFIKTDAKDREEGKRKIMYGLLGMFIMFSAYGLIHVILATFDIQSPKYIQL